MTVLSWPSFAEDRDDPKTAGADPDFIQGEDGRFQGSRGSGMTRAQEAATVPVEKAGKRIQEIATSEDWGKVDPPGGDPARGMHGPEGPVRWGTTTIDDGEWAASHEEAVTALNEAGLPGEQIATTVGGWSYGMDVDVLRDAYGGKAVDSDAQEAAIDYLRESLGSMDGAAGMFNLVRNNEVDGTLYRGAVVDALDVEAMKPGAELGGALTSWSRDRDVAECFTQPQLVNRSISDPVKVILEREGGHGLDIATLGAREYAWQQEVISADPLKITAIERGDDFVRVKVAA